MEQSNGNTTWSRVMDWAMSIAVVGALVFSVGGLTNVLAAGDRSDDQSAQTSQPETNKETTSLEPSEIRKVFGQDTEVVSLEHLSTSGIKTIQRKLREMGHYDGAVDGIVSSQTRDALRSFNARRAEISRQLLQDYQVTTATLDVLGVNHSDIQKVGGAEEGGARGGERPEMGPSEMQPEPSREADERGLEPDDDPQPQSNDGSDFDEEPPPL